MSPRCSELAQVWAGYNVSVLCGNVTTNDARCVQLGSAAMGLALVRVQAPMEGVRAYPVALPVHRVCDNTTACGNISVAWELMAVDARKSRDFAPMSGVLQWAANETSQKMIYINVPRISTRMRPVAVRVVLSGAFAHVTKHSTKIQLDKCAGNYDAAGAACLENFHGSRCSNFCQVNTTCGGRGTCSAEGLCSCLPGYVGDSCEIGLACASNSQCSTNQCVGGVCAVNTINMPAVASASWAGTCAREAEGPCGDGVRTQLEECDDGNDVTGNYVCACVCACICIKV